MPFSTSVSGLAVLVLYVSGVAADSFFFNNTNFIDQVANISSGCATAMQVPLSCDPYLTYVMTSDYWGSLGNDTIQDRFCSPTCGSDLASYVSNVSSACSADPQPLPGYPATYWGDSAQAAWKQMCLKDNTTGLYCSEFIENLFSSSANGSTDDSNWPTVLPPDQVCSDCVVDLFVHLQSTPYSNYDENMASDWSSIQSQCKLSYPTAVPALQTNVTQPGGYAAPGSAKSGCITGNTYAVVSGDNCESICETQHCSTGTLIAINDLYSDCSNLNAGATLCIPPTCTTYNVQSGDDCNSIANATGTTYQQLVAWNPALGGYCTNLFSGQSICASPPGGAVALTTIPGATVTQTAVYATATVARPSPVASGTTRDCGKYYEVALGDNCQLVSVNQTIALGLFEAINPAINSDCTNLELGVYYCVSPTADWNSTSTASSTVVTAPTTTPSGTTADCYEYYTIASGDYCGKVEDMFAISMGQLQFWNPALLADCSNLALGEAYCVNGAEQPPSGSTPVPTPSGGSKEKAKLKGRNMVAALPALPKRTAAPAQGGGVPRGYPGLNAPRRVGGAGNVKSEL